MHQIGGKGRNVRCRSDEQNPHRVGTLQAPVEPCPDPGHPEGVEQPEHHQHRAREHRIAAKEDPRAEDQELDAERDGDPTRRAPPARRPAQIVQAERIQHTELRYDQQDDRVRHLQDPGRRDEMLGPGQRNVRARHERPDVGQPGHCQVGRGNEPHHARGRSAPRCVV